MLHECCNYLFLSILTAGCFDHVVCLVFSHLHLAFTIHRAYQPILREQLYHLLTRLANCVTT